MMLPPNIWELEVGAHFHTKVPKQMRCPTLAELPAPPKDKTGWPWTIESSPLPEIRSDGNTWPKITIVTPSYNQDSYIEQTIRSILLQGYPNLEYIIVDGKSTDRSVEIIQRYSPYLTRWSSEPDAGQANAINKGFLNATGSWLNWINSDDLLAPDALKKIAHIIGIRSDADIISGTRLLSRSNQMGWSVDPVWQNSWRSYLINGGMFPQECTFYSAFVAELIGPLNEAANFKFDIIHYLKALRVSRRIVLTNEILGIMHVHEFQKTRAVNVDRTTDDAVIKEINNSRCITDRLIGRLASTRFADIVLSIYQHTNNSGKRLEILDHDWLTGVDRIIRLA